MEDIVVEGAFLNNALTAFSNFSLCAPAFRDMRLCSENVSMKYQTQLIIASYT